MAICSKKLVLKRHIPGRGPEIAQSGRGGGPPRGRKETQGDPKGDPRGPKGTPRRDPPKKAPKRPQSDEGTNDERRSTRMN